VIIGEGPLYKKLKKIAGENTILLGRQSDDVVKYCYENCYAYIHPAKDDFGISPVEAMLFGKPVLAYRGGGAQESVIEGISGEFFDFEHPAALADGVRRIVENYDNYSKTMIRQIGARFSKERFAEELRQVIKKILVHELNGKNEAAGEDISAQPAFSNSNVLSRGEMRKEKNVKISSKTA
jgi:glycosyltransferase involved in cell wall biosynthesis